VGQRWGKGKTHTSSIRKKERDNNTKTKGKCSIRIQSPRLSERGHTGGEKRRMEKGPDG